MKNKKRKINKNILILIVSGIVLLFIIGSVIYKNINRFELSVGDSKVSKEEYLACMKAVEYDTKIEIQQKYDCEYTEDFWEKKYDDKFGYEILAENTIERLQYINAVYEVAKENGDVKDSSFAGLEKRWKAENAEREEKIKNGEVVYGVKEYTFELYLQYEMSTLKEKYCNDKKRKGMTLTEEEVLEHYNSRKWTYGEEEEELDLETARVSVEQEIREKKYDEIIEKKMKNSQVVGEMGKISRFTLKNI